MSATTPDEIVRTLAAFFEATSTSAVAVANASCTSVLRQKRHVHVVECAGEGTVASVVATDLLLKSLYSVRTLRVHELETAIAFTKRTIDMASHMFTVSVRRRGCAIGYPIDAREWDLARRSLPLERDLVCADRAEHAVVVRRFPSRGCRLRPTA